MEKQPDIFNKMADYLREENKKLMQQSGITESMLKSKEWVSKHTLDTKEPETDTCEECQCYSSDGVKFAGKYFCNEECQQNYYRGINDLIGHDMYDMMKERGLEGYY